MRAQVLTALAIFTVAAAACGGDERSDASASDGPCAAPELQDFRVSRLEASDATCATAGAVAAAATACYFASPVGECPGVEVGGKRWDCSFAITGPPGSGGLSEGVCLAQGGSEVSFDVQRQVL